MWIAYQQLWRSVPPASQGLLPESEKRLCHASGSAHALQRVLMPDTPRTCAPSIAYACTSHLDACINIEPFRLDRSMSAVVQLFQRTLCKAGYSITRSLHGRLGASGACTRVLCRVAHCNAQLGQACAHYTINRTRAHGGKHTLTLQCIGLQSRTWLLRTRSSRGRPRSQPSAAAAAGRSCRGGGQGRPRRSRGCAGGGAARPGAARSRSRTASGRLLESAARSPA